MTNWTNLALAIGIAFVTLVFGPSLYNHYLFPLGQLHKSIEIGDSYDAVYSKFTDYFERYGSADNEVVLNNGFTTEDFYSTPIRSSAYVFLYDVNIFDDIQLGVLFDERRQAKKIFFVGD